MCYANANNHFQETDRREGDTGAKIFSNALIWCFITWFVLGKPFSFCPFASSWRLEFMAADMRGLCCSKALQQWRCYTRPTAISNITDLCLCVWLFEVRAGECSGVCVCVCWAPTESPSLCCVAGSLPNQGSLHEVSVGVSRERRGDQSPD